MYWKTLARFSRGTEVVRPPDYLDALSYQNQVGWANQSLNTNNEDEMNKVSEFYDRLSLKNPWPEAEDPGVEIQEDMVHGWFSDHHKKALSRLIQKHKIKNVIELGSWEGRSTRWFGLQKEIELIVAVDHWEGSPEHHRNEKFRERLPNLYEKFLRNTYSLNNKVAPLRMPTDEAFKLDLPNENTLVYVDAAHDTESVIRDIGKYIGFTENGGVICGDDWGWKTVKKGVKEFVKQHDKRIELLNEKMVWTISERRSISSFLTSFFESPK